MPLKPHLFYQKDPEGETRFRQKTRFQETDEDNDLEEPENNDPKKEDFAASLGNWATEEGQRIAARNPELEVPVYIDAVRLFFHNSFDAAVFEVRYREDFGLSMISYELFNTEGVFAIVDRPRFDFFLEQIRLFINTPDDDPQPSYHPNIRYIRSFRFYSTAERLQYVQLNPVAVLDVFDNPEIHRDVFMPIYQRLRMYLTERNIIFLEDLVSNRMELKNIAGAQLQEIADNFDIIHSINSFATGVIRPGAFNLPDRSFGFEISNANERLPLIAILDTGIQSGTPLDPIVINVDETFSLTGTPCREDRVNHGTAVAALAALGDRLYKQAGNAVESDAGLLSIKVLDNGSGAVAEQEVLDKIREAYINLGVRIFVLTICYTTPKAYNQSHSSYALSLDKLIHELDILVVICVGNNDDLMEFDGRGQRVRNYPALFDREEHNLYPPAELINGISVGASAWNMEAWLGQGVTPDPNYPAIYSRTHHIDWSHYSITKHRVNKRLYKPDILCFGGDLNPQIGPDPYGLKILSVLPGEFFVRETGTSYAAPLVANIAARLLRLYPNITKMQTIKALILNGSTSQNNQDFFAGLSRTRINGIQGNGVADGNRILYSDDNRVTFVLESEIEPDKIRSYDLEVPEYLLGRERKNGVLHVEATLCFSCDPIAHNHLAYLPIHIAFGVFRNLVLEEYNQTDIVNDDGEIETKIVATGINHNAASNIKFAESWSQDYYFRPKLLSNAQKVVFNISKKALEDEKCKFKISMQCKLHKLLASWQKAAYQHPHPFSLVISIQENPAKGQTTGRLYDELVALNELVAVTDADAFAELA